MANKQRIKQALISAKGPPNQCYWCGVKLIEMKMGLAPYGTKHPHNLATVEHIVNRADGGTNDVSNLEWACYGCNVRRGSRRDLQARCR